MQAKAGIGAKLKLSMCKISDSLLFSSQKHKNCTKLRLYPEKVGHNFCGMCIYRTPYVLFLLTQQVDLTNLLWIVSLNAKQILIITHHSSL